MIKIIERAVYDDEDEQSVDDDDMAEIVRVFAVPDLFRIRFES